MLEGQLEQSQELAEGLQTSVDNYKQKLHTTTEQLEAVERSLGETQDNLVETRKRVRIVKHKPVESIKAGVFINALNTGVNASALA